MKNKSTALLFLADWRNKNHNAVAAGRPREKKIITPCRPGPAAKKNHNAVPARPGREKNHNAVLGRLRRPDLGICWAWSRRGNIPLQNPYEIKLNERLQPSPRKIITPSPPACPWREKNHNAVPARPGRENKIITPWPPAGPAKIKS